MNHLRWRETNLVGSRVQAAAKSEILCRLRFSSDIPSINSDCRGAEKLEFDCHLFVSNEHFIHFRRDAFGSQDISYQLYCCGMRRAVRHIQDFDFHSSLSLRGFSLKIGQRVSFAALCCNRGVPTAQEERAVGACGNRAAISKAR